MATKSPAKYAPQEGDRVRVVERMVTAEDRKGNRYFTHMANLTGTVQNIYDNGEIAIKMDLETLSTVSRDVHTRAEKRMQERFAKDSSEETKRQLTEEELKFGVHYVLLIQAEDLEKL